MSALRRLALGAIAVAGLLGPAPAATAATDGPCSGTAGVTVVVDATAVGGRVQVRCAPGPTGDGFDGFAALAQAGFTVTQPLRTSGFVCRIDGRPGPDVEACVDTPPPTAYWSYWTAPRGGTWAYSSLGAAARRPAAGSVEGWSFSRGGAASDARPPSIPPPAATELAPPTSAPAPPSGGPAAPAPRAVAGVTTTRDPGRAPVGAGVSTTTTAIAAVPGATPSAAPGAGPAATPTSADSASIEPSSTEPSPAADGSGTVERADARAVAARSSTGDPDTGSPVPTVLGGLLLAGLVGAAVVVGRRRRPGATPS